MEVDEESLDRPRTSFYCSIEFILYKLVHFHLLIAFYLWSMMPKTKQIPIRLSLSRTFANGISLTSKSFPQREASHLYFSHFYYETILSI